jgi:copper chaperone
MTTTVLSVPDISCGHCKESIEGAVAQLAGVATVSVDIEQRTVKVDYDDTAVSLDTINASIEEQGYEVA